MLAFAIAGVVAAVAALFASTIWLGLRFRPRRLAAMAAPDRNAPAPFDAYGFHSALSLSVMLAKLNAETPWIWREGDSGWVGDYLSATVVEGGSLRLYAEGAGYVLEMRRAALNPVIRAKIVDQLLPLLEAEGVWETDGFD